MTLRPLCLLAAIAASLTILAAGARMYTVPGPSLRPDLDPGDKAVVSLMAYDWRLPLGVGPSWRRSDPRAGDIVLVDKSQKDLAGLKRVVALPGDRVSLHENRLVINGQSVTLSPARVRLPDFGPVTLPHDHYFVFCDVHEDAQDRHHFGPLPRSAILGRMVAKF